MDIIEYVKTYSQYSFMEKPFNEVDGLVLSQFSYLKWDRQIPGFMDDCDAVSLSDLVKDIDYDYVCKSELYPELNEELLNSLLISKRYCNMSCNYYSDRTDDEVETQFCAFTIFLEGALPVVVFRGTDGTLIGWKEDFNMAFSKPTAGQGMASLYLKQVSLRIAGQFNVAGHSKGGNFATYSVLEAGKDIRKKVNNIYCYDSPGFRPEVLKENNYNDISDKVKKYIPDASLVGVIMESTKDFTTIQSQARSGVFQHNPYSWMIEDDHFVIGKPLKRHSWFVNKSMNQWIMEMDERQFSVLLNTMFDDVLAASDEDTFLGMLTDWKTSIPAVLSALYDVDDKTKKVMSKVILGVLEAMSEVIKDKYGR